ncbi:MAG: SDR family oxidoreductase [Euryarchaeota archaeon]|jgi:NAD(P)-dependent dehydrogenase (short-subunit alcohol dehydrogenase family)|nr:SDR family oxidoreductase [Euryarchaeota archaeon]MBT5592990.1 SDR family oxidoreductase [Euryarchaeota archaeon]
MATWVITGGNRGIGKEFILQLIQENHTIITGVRDPELMDLEHELLSVFKLDVSNTQSVTEFAQSVSQHTDRVNVLINNAGQMDGRWQSIDEVDPDVSLEVLNVNTIGPLRVAQALWPLLEATGQSKVANITSLMGSIEDCQSGRSYAYRTSKTGLNMITKILSVEGKDADISVSCYHPGWVLTDMGGERAPVLPQESVKGLIELIEMQTLERSGRFFEYTGVELPW